MASLTDRRPSDGRWTLGAENGTRVRCRRAGLGARFPSVVRDLWIKAPQQIRDIASTVIEDDFEEEARRLTAGLRFMGKVTEPEPRKRGGQ